jgi:hypothetical protein
MGYGMTGKELSHETFAAIMRGEVTVPPAVALNIRLRLRKERRRAQEWSTPKPRRARPRCGAKTRTGKPCKRRPISGRRRCRNHGGLSTGATTEAGREAIRQSNRRRALAKRQA